MNLTKIREYIWIALLVIAILFIVFAQTGSSDTIRSLKKANKELNTSLSKYQVRTDSLHKRLKVYDDSIKTLVNQTVQVAVLRGSLMVSN